MVKILVLFHSKYHWKSLKTPQKGDQWISDKILQPSSQPQGQFPLSMIQKLSISSADLLSKSCFSFAQAQKPEILNKQTHKNLTCFWTRRIFYSWKSLLVAFLNYTQCASRVPTGLPPPMGAPHLKSTCSTSFNQLWKSFKKLNTIHVPQRNVGRPAGSP